MKPQDQKKNITLRLEEESSEEWPIRVWRKIKWKMKNPLGKWRILWIISLNMELENNSSIEKWHQDYDMLIVTLLLNV
jgi:hypothetical protein